MRFSFMAMGSPVPYSRPKQGKSGGRFTDDNLRKAMATVGDAARVKADKAGWPAPKMKAGTKGERLVGPSGKFSIHIRFRRDKKRGDLDNMVKTVLDALTKAAIWYDDAMVHEIHASVLDVETDPFTWVEVNMEEA